jgi:putative modified peptide
VAESDRIERGAELLERLITDGAFRARFRANPEAACREAGFPDLADEIAQTGGSLQTLELRESRSSLVGVLMAAALEGVGVLELSHLVGSGLHGEAAAAANRALTRSSLRAVGHGTGGLHPPHAPHIPHQPHVPHPHATPPSHAPAGGDQAQAAAAPADPAAASPQGPPSAAAGTGVPAVDAHAAGAPAANAPSAAAPAEPWPDSPGAAGAPAAAAAATGPPASLQQLVDDPRLTVSAQARADLLSGSVDPRFAQVLDTLAKDHKLGIGSVEGGGLDIASVDGAPVGPGNPAARELMSALANLDPSVRPSRVAGPWPISAPGFTSDASSQDHIHIAFDSAAPPGAQPAAAPPGPAAAHGTIAFSGQASPAQAAPPADPTAHPRAAAAAAQGLPDAGAAAVGHAGGGFDLATAAREYPGAEASKAALAKWMGDQAERAGLPRELPVMASLVESGLTNVNYGDRDSLGFFQMRTSVWLSQYPDYPHHPEQQLKWFIDQALAVKRQRLAAGQSGFVDDPNQWGNWIADVERPAEAYRGRYQLRLGEARSLIGQAGGPQTAPPPPAAEPAPAAAAAPASPAPAPAGAQPAAAAGPAQPAGAATPSPQSTLQFTAAPAGPPAAADAAVPLPGSTVTQPGSPPHALREIFERAAILDHRHLPYLWGGGHQAGVADVATTEPVDCSGAVSAVLGVDARVSGQFENWGEAGPGRYVTVYANEEHVLMEINGHFFGTSTANPGGGAGWIPRAHVPPSYLARFTARHPPGL